MGDPERREINPNEEVELTNKQLLKAAEIILSPEFIERIQEMREEKDLRLSQMARRAGISRTWLWQIEMGRSTLLENGEAYLRILRVLLG